MRKFLLAFLLPAVAAAQLSITPAGAPDALRYGAQTLTAAQGVQAVANLNLGATPGIGTDIWLDSTAADRGFYIKTVGGSVGLFSQYANDKAVLAAPQQISLTPLASGGLIQVGLAQAGVLAAPQRMYLHKNGTATAIITATDSTILQFDAGYWSGSALDVSAYLQLTSDTSGNAKLNLTRVGGATMRLVLPLGVRNVNPSIAPAGALDGSVGLCFTDTSGGFVFGTPGGVGTIRWETAAAYLLSPTGTATIVNMAAAAGGGALQTSGFVDQLNWSTSGVYVKGGGSTDPARVGGTLSTDTTQTGNSGTGEDTLQTATVTAAMLSTNGDTYAFVVAGTIANSINAKRIRVKFGSTPIFDSGAAGIPISAAIDWSIEGEIIRTGATTQKCVARMTTNNATLASYCDYSTAAETLSGAVTFLITGEAVDNNDVVKELFKGYFKR